MACWTASSFLKPSLEAPGVKLAQTGIGDNFCCFIDQPLADSANGMILLMLVSRRMSLEVFLLGIVLLDWRTLLVTGRTPLEVLFLPIALLVWRILLNTGKVSLEVLLLFCRVVPLDWRTSLGRHGSNVSFHISDVSFLISDISFLISGAGVVQALYPVLVFWTLFCYLCGVLVL